MKTRSSVRARKPKRRRRPVPEGLASAAELQDLYGKSERTWQRYVAQGLPVARPGKGGRPSLYSRPAVERWLQEHAAEPEDDALLDDGQTSEALEKWRNERYREAKRKNDVAEGRLLPIEKAREELQVIFGSLRAELEAVGRAHGPGVTDAIREAVERAERATELRFPAPLPDAPAAAAAPELPAPPAPAAAASEVATS